MKTTRLRGIHRSVSALVCLVTFVGIRGSAQQIISRTFDAEEGGTVKVVLGAGNIQITPWNNNTVRVNAVCDDEDISMSQNGNNVTVRSSSDVNVQLSVPVRINLDLQCGSGDIQIDGSLNGTVRGRTSGGEIDIRNCSGNVSMSTGGGGITCGDIKGKVSVQSSGGDLQLGDVAGDADLETDGGDVDVKNVEKSIIARTSGGNVSVGRVGGGARLSTSGGDIEVGPVADESTLESSGGNVIVHGSGGRVSATTSGGDVMLDHAEGSFYGSTSAGNITAIVNAHGKRSDGRLSSGGGNILLEISPDANATIVAKIHNTDRWQENADQSTITSDFPSASYRRDDRTGDITATYRLNGGAGSITLDASMGSITIRKGTH